MGLCFSCLPPSPNSHDGPYGFDNPERPGALEKSIDRSQNTAAAECKNEPGAAFFERVTDKHCSNCEKAEDSKTVHRCRLSPIHADQLIRHPYQLMRIARGNHHPARLAAFGQERHPSAAESVVDNNRMAINDPKPDGPAVVARTQAAIDFACRHVRPGKCLAEDAVRDVHVIMGQPDPDGAEVEPDQERKDHPHHVEAAGGRLGAYWTVIYLLIESDPHPAGDGQKYH